MRIRLRAENAALRQRVGELGRLGAAQYDECGQLLRVFPYCPPCAGRRGGWSRSEKKLQASRRNIERTQLMRAKRRKKRREIGQVIHT
jgi:hypothetical protein